MTALAPLADACPRCLPGDFPAVAPWLVTAASGGSLKALYRHEACGHEWRCWWDAEAADWPQVPGPRPPAVLHAGDLNAAYMATHDGAAPVRRATGPLQRLTDDNDNRESA